MCSSPKMSSSATRPPILTSIWASSWALVSLQRSFSGSRDTCRTGSRTTGMSCEILFGWLNKWTKMRREAYVSQSWTTRHDGGLVDRHCIFGEIGNDGMARLVVGSDGLVLLVNLYTPPLGALQQKRPNKLSTSDFAGIYRLLSFF